MEHIAPLFTFKFILPLKRSTSVVGGERFIFTCLLVYSCVDQKSKVFQSLLSPVMLFTLSCSFHFMLVHKGLPYFL